MVSRLLTCFIAFIVIPLILPVLILFLIPLMIYRKVIEIMARFLRPDLQNIMTHLSTNFAGDDLYTKPETIIHVGFTIEGNIPIQLFLNIIENRVFKMKLPDGQIRYPEFKQYWVNWMGFRFWKIDESFKLENHVKLYSNWDRQGGNKFVSEKELQEIRQEYLTRPLERDQSPWEILIIHNYEATQIAGQEAADENCNQSNQTNQIYSAILFKNHHALGDGYAMTKMLHEGVMGQPKYQPPNLKNDSNLNRNGFLELVRMATFPIRLLYESTNALYLGIKSSPWDLDSYSSDPNGNNNNNNNNKFPYCFHALSGRIPIERVKKIRHHFGVSFSSVVFAACSGVMQEVMFRKGMNMESNVSCVVPFPLPGHPDTLRNHLTLCNLNLPVKNGLCFSKRVKILHESYEALKSSTIPFFAWIGPWTVGGLIDKLGDPLVKALIPPVFISNFPGVPDNSFIEGYRVVDDYFVCGLMNLFGLAFFVMSFEGGLRVGINARSSLLTQEEVREMVSLVEKQFNLLEN